MTAHPDAAATPDDQGSRQSARAVAVIVTATAVKLAVFAALERPWGCDCGRIWAMPGDPALNSQTLLDPYSLLHAVTGALLVLMVTRLRPDPRPLGAAGRRRRQQHDLGGDREPARQHPPVRL